MVYPVLDAFLLTTTASTAPGLIFQERIFHHTNSICHSQLTAGPPVMQSPPSPPLPWPSCSPIAGKANPAAKATLTPLIFVLKKGPSEKASQATLATLTPLIFFVKKGLSGKARHANLVIPAAVLWCPTRIKMMVKQKGRKVAAAAARAVKDKQIKALQQDMGLLSHEDGEELAPRTPPKLPHGTQ
jgi:hypothetical protein